MMIPFALSCAKENQSYARLFNLKVQGDNTNRHVLACQGLIVEFVWQVRRVVLLSIY
jgi:hypothetical protein